MQDVIWGIILGIWGIYALKKGITFIISSRFAWGICLALWGLCWSAFGIFHIAKGLRHPLLSEDANGIIFLISGIVCMVTLLAAALTDRNKYNNDLTNE